MDANLPSTGCLNLFPATVLLFVLGLVSILIFILIIRRRVTTIGGQVLSWGLLSLGVLMIISGLYVFLALKGVDYQIEARSMSTFLGTMGDFISPFAIVVALISFAVEKEMQAKRENAEYFKTEIRKHFLRIKDKIELVSTIISNDLFFTKLFKRSAMDEYEVKDLFELNDHLQKLIEAKFTYSSVYKILIMREFREVFANSLGCNPEINNELSSEIKYFLDEISTNNIKIKTYLDTLSKAASSKKEYQQHVVFCNEIVSSFGKINRELGDRLNEIENIEGYSTGVRND